MRGSVGWIILVLMRIMIRVSYIHCVCDLCVVPIRHCYIDEWSIKTISFDNNKEVAIFHWSWLAKYIDLT